MISDTDICAILTESSLRVCGVDCYQAPATMSSGRTVILVFVDQVDVDGVRVQSHPSMYMPADVSARCIS